MKIYKYIAIVAMVFIVSFFYFPVSLRILPGRNTKMIMAAIGVAIAVWTLIKDPNSIPRNIVPVILWGCAMSIVSSFAMVFNGTGDTSYVTYFVSMMVWIGGAYTVCTLVRYLHGYIDVRLIGNYIIAVCVMQCITVLLIDNFPAFDRFSNSLFDLGKPMMNLMKRKYGWGAGLDVAGIRFSLCLIIIAAFITDKTTKNSQIATYCYVLSYYFIAVIGCTVARTTYVGIGLSVMLMAVAAFRDRFTGYWPVVGSFLGFAVVAVVACVILCRVYPLFYRSIRFAFEGFFNLFERGEYSVASTETLKSMYVFPDNLKTWIIGDGYFVNPYWSDTSYVWHGVENIKGYYKGTDVGYLRFIFYCGLIGLTIFAIYFIKCAKTCSELNPEYKFMFTFLCLAGFVVWLKVATDVFLIFALFICVGNMMEPKEDGGKDTDIEKLEE